MIIYAFWRIFDGIGIDFEGKAGHLPGVRVITRLVLLRVESCLEC